MRFMIKSAFNEHVHLLKLHVWAAKIPHGDTRAVIGQSYKLL